MHMFSFLLDDAGIPANYTKMNGAGVHTFVLINAMGKETYVKFHWISEQGEENLLDDEAERQCGKDFSHATHQLINSIASGQFPAWKLCIQTMDPQTELNYDWGDPLDPTKTWPEDQFPLREVGRMVLTQNCDNQYAEAEQLALSPGNLIPGIAASGKFSFANSAAAPFCDFP